MGKKTSYANALPVLFGFYVIFFFSLEFYLWLVSTLV